MAIYRTDKAAHIEADVKHLHGYGYAQQLFRDMGGFANFSVSFSIISILTGAVILYGFGLNNGGPGMNGIGWPLITLFTILVSASMAELASAIPTAGALYHWSSAIGGPRWGWWTAWMNFIGQFTITAGIDYAAANFATALIFSPNDTAITGNFVPTKLLLVYAVILFSHGFINHFGARLVALAASFSAVYHMAVVGFIVFVLAFFTNHGHGSVHQVYNVVNITPTNPLWYAFLLGLLQSQWTYTGYDASAHISEETVHPRVRAPWGVFMSVAVSGFFGYVMLWFVTWSIVDVAKTAGASGSGGPFIQVFRDQFSQDFGTGMLWAITIAMWFCGLSSVTSNSRLLFAFARDGGFPGSRWWSRVSKVWRTPTYAIWAAVVVAFAVVIWAKTIAAITGISTIALYVSYVMPVALRYRARKRGEWQTKHDGPWALGRWSNAVNLLAIAWVACITVFFVLPYNVRHPKVFTDAVPWITGDFIVLFTFIPVLAILAVYFMLGPRNSFKGPKRLGTEEELYELEQEYEAESVWKEPGQLRRPERAPSPAPGGAT